jgi:hypothetical protein
MSPEDPEPTIPRKGPLALVVFRGLLLATSNLSFFNVLTMALALGCLRASASTQSSVRAVRRCNAAAPPSLAMKMQLDTDSNAIEMPSI